MRWCIAYHPGIKQTGIIPETALEIHRRSGWYRISDWATDQTALNPAECDPAVDLDESDANFTAAPDADPRSAAVNTPAELESPARESKPTTTKTAIAADKNKEKS